MQYFSLRNGSVITYYDVEFGSNWYDDRLHGEYHNESYETYPDKLVFSGLCDNIGASYTMYYAPKNSYVQLGTVFTKEFDENNIPIYAPPAGCIDIIYKNNCGYTPDGNTAICTPEEGEYCLVKYDSEIANYEVFASWTVDKKYWTQIDLTSGQIANAAQSSIKITDEHENQRIRIDLTTVGGPVRLVLSENIIDSTLYCIYDGTNYQSIQAPLTDYAYHILSYELSALKYSNNEINGYIVGADQLTLDVLETGTYYLYYNDIDSNCRLFDVGNDIYMYSCLMDFDQVTDSIPQTYTRGNFYVYSYDKTTIGHKELEWTDETSLSDGTYYYRAILNDNGSSATSNHDSVVIDNILDNNTSVNWTDETDLNDGTYYYRAILTSNTVPIATNTDSIIIDRVTDAQTSLSWTDETNLNAGNYWYRANVISDGTGTATNSDLVTITSAPDPDSEPGILENPQRVSWTDESELAEETEYFYRSVVTDNGAEIMSNVDGITTGRTISWTDGSSKAPGNYYYRAIVTSGGAETVTNYDGVSITTAIINLSGTTFEIEAHATSSKHILCTLKPTFGPLSGITVQWQYTTSDPESGTPEWTNYCISEGSTQTISGITANERHWFRAILTQGEETQITESDDNWLTQIVNNAGFVQSESPVIIKRGECAICKGRIIKGNGNAIVPEDILSIHYTIFKRPTALYETENTIINGHNNISVEVFPAVLKNPVVDDYYIWDIDDIGYNFLHSPNQGITDPFPEPGFYALNYEILMINGRKVTPVFNVNMLN